MSEDYKKGYREGYQDGMDAARKIYDPFMPIAPVFPPVSKNCKVCGIEWSKATHYVCNLSSCPTKVSC